MTIPRFLELLSRHAIDRHSFHDVRSVAGRYWMRSAMPLQSSTVASATFVFRPTVLAQDDSGVGVKNAVNQFGLKQNLIEHLCTAVGDHQRPVPSLTMLPPREKRGGMAEAVKVALNPRR